MLGTFVEKRRENHLCELSPINIMSGIEFEDERVIYFSPGPYPARNAEEKRKEPHQKIATIDLSDTLACNQANVECHTPYLK